MIRCYLLYVAYIREWSLMPDATLIYLFSGAVKGQLNRCLGYGSDSSWFSDKVT